MKKMFLAAILGLLICNIMFSQKCKYETNEIDDFTSKKVVVTEAQRLMKAKLTLSGLYNYEKNYFKLGIQQGSIYSVDEGSLVRLKQKNEAIIDLTVGKSVIPEYHSYAHSWFGEVTLHVNDEQKGIFTKGNVIVI